jgi:hypothetical protein
MIRFSHDDHARQEIAAAEVPGDSQQILQRHLHRHGRNVVEVGK